MWIKYVGGGLLVVVSVLYCMQSNRQLRRVKRRLGAWIALLTHIRSHIACFGTPLREIVARADQTVLGALELNATEGIEQTITEHCRLDAPTLPGNSPALMKGLADELGTVWRREQIERLDHYISALEKEQEAYAAGLNDRLRLRNSLCLCATLGVLLLIW